MSITWKYFGQDAPDYRDSQDFKIFKINLLRVIAEGADTYRKIREKLTESDEYDGGAVACALESLELDGLVVKDESSELITRFKVGEKQRRPVKVQLFNRTRLGYEEG